MWNRITQLVYFSYLLQVVTDSGLGCVEVKCKFSNNFVRIAFRQSPERIFIKVLEALESMGSSLSLSNYFARTKHWKSVSDLAMKKKIVDNDVNEKDYIQR